MRRLLVLLALAAPLLSAQARIDFIKKFPGSTPSYLHLWVDAAGKGEYRESPDDDQPFPLRLSPEEASAVFDLARKLGHFATPLESGLKVAFTGEKTLRFTDGETRHETTFNYTANPDGQKLLDWMERIAETARHATNLERTARFDRLGLDRALLELQYAYEQKRLAGATQLLPILDRIARNKSAFNRVRERAATLAEAIRSGKPPSP